MPVQVLPFSVFFYIFLIWNLVNAISNKHAVLNNDIARMYLKAFWHEI